MFSFLLVIANMFLGSDYSIDQSTAGNFTRFFNHSCSPNYSVERQYSQGCERLVVRANTQQFEFAEELTIDYGSDYDYNAYFGRKGCLCGSENCRRRV